MRRRQHRRDGRTLVAGMLLSALLHAALYGPVAGWLEGYFQSSPRPDGPVRVVRLSEAQYQQSLADARRIRDRAGPRAKARSQARQAEREAPPKPEAPEKKRERLDGQVVDIPP
ncbi:MAG: hypothetical protein HC923_12715, partial [Myxococcales bacterium]|nr:hypothetical protein [Myxococcales bacterium]